MRFEGIWYVHGVWWLQDTKLMFPTFFFVALSGDFCKNVFFRFFDEESVLVTCGVLCPCYRGKTRSGPSGAHRGNQRAVWLHPACMNSRFCFFSSRFMWPCYRLSRQNAVFERFFWRSRSHRVKGNYMFDTQKTRSWNTQHVLICNQILIPGAGVDPPTKWKFVFRAITSSLFVAHKPHLTRPRRATPFREPDR